MAISDKFRARRLPCQAESGYALIVRRRAMGKSILPFFVLLTRGCALLLIQRCRARYTQRILRLSSACSTPMPRQPAADFGGLQAA